MPLNTACRLLVPFSLYLTLLQSAPAQALPDPYYAMPESETGNAVTDTAIFESKMGAAAAERERFAQHLQQVTEQERSIEAQIANAHKAEAKGGARSPILARQLTELLAEQKQARLNEQSDKSSIVTVEQWVKYWQSHLQNMQWNKRQASLAADIANKQTSEAVTNRALEAETAQGTQQWQQINYMPPQIDVPDFLGGGFTVTGGRGWGLGQ